MVHCLSTMGQHSSLPKGRKKSMKSSTRVLNTLSHTFTLYTDDYDKIQLVNLNTASEEELMTLDGINRETARNIVEHRKAIGRFRKVEDLALVKGVGADKMQRLKPEICVSSRKVSTSRSTSRAPSCDSLRSNESKATFRYPHLINVNRATVFDLQSVCGITQEIAAAIVLYREKKGDFKRLEDLLKVKCVDRVRLNNIAMYLTIDDGLEDIPESNCVSTKPLILTNGYTMPTPKYSSNKLSTIQHRKIPIANGLSHTLEFDIFELLSAYSPRPALQKFNYTRDGDSAIRLGSWNLHDFTLEKSSNLGVKEVICRTILENGLSILAIQGVVNVTALRAICEELNNSTLARVKEWGGAATRNWNFCMLDAHDSKLGFIYDNDDGFDIELLSLRCGPEDTRKECETLVATFRVENLTLELVNLMLNESTNVEGLTKKLQESSLLEKEFLIVFVDFSNATDIIMPSSTLKPMFSPNSNTCFYQGASSTQHVSNIFCNSKAEKQITGKKEIVKRGLTHLAIPNGWTWGGPVSPFCPVWLEMFITDITAVTFIGSVL